MKIKFLTDSFVPTLATVVSVVNPKNPLQILSNVRIQTLSDENGTVYANLSSSDSEVWLQMRVDCMYADCGIDACVEAKPLLTALRNLGSNEVVMAFDSANNTVTFNYTNGKFSLPYEETDSWPTPAASADDSYEKRIENDKLATCISKTCFAVGNSEIRPIMNGIHFNFSEDYLTCVATDGHKLAIYKDLTVKSLDGECCFTLPTKPCSILMGILPVTIASYIKVVFCDNCAIFSNSMFALTATLVAGKYPNYNSIIPKDNDKTAILNKADFIAALKRVIPLGDSSQLVALEFTEDNMNISSTNYEYTRSASEDVKCEYQNKRFTIGFKGCTLLQLLQKIDCDTVEFSLKKPTSAGVLRETQSNNVYDYMSLAMPMVIQ